MGKEIVLWSRFPSKQQVLSFDKVTAFQIRLLSASHGILVLNNADLVGLDPPNHRVRFLFGRSGEYRPSYDVKLNSAQANECGFNRLMTKFHTHIVSIDKWLLMLVK